ncbi:MAG TPA: hypothetical protein DCL49_05850 [Candidatus Omnitrophica bacterium]|nr:hypothetical protein [Candidatus Omnitrophota bacterium]HBU08853.1 hypothetical protein [Candidatus Omnitrophota bacterium]
MFSKERRFGAVAEAGNRYSFIGRASLLIWGIVFLIVCLELSLRLAGFAYNRIYPPPINTEAGYKIFCLGESTTWGIGASNPISQGYPKQLENMLNKKFPDLNTQCFFDQTIGQNTSEINRKLEGYIKKYVPDLIIIMTGANNWWNLDKSNILLFNKSRFISESVLKISVFLGQFRVCKLFKLVYYSIVPYRERWNFYFPSGISGENLEEAARERYDFDIFAMVANYDIRSMVRTCKANRVDIIISGYPGNVNDDLYFTQKQIAEEFKIPFVDNYAIFRNLPNRRDYFSDDNWHPNEDGYNLLARNIYNSILENNIINISY